MRTSHLLLTALTFGTLSTLAACAGESGGDGGGDATSSSSSSGTTTSSTTTSSSSGGGEGGGTGGGGTGGTGGGTTGTPADHLLISEMAVEPITHEFVEIYNPTTAAIDLTNVYLSDNSTYHQVTAGTWSPITNNPGTDFLARFPSGASIPAGGVIVIGFDPGYETAYSDCPDFYVGTAALSCNGGSVPAMLAPVAGSITDNAGLSDNDEMLMLFSWSGTASDPVEDLDYVIWGAFDAADQGARVDKTGVAGYVPDTARGSQQSTTGHEFEESVQRCELETGEDLSGGNGITGHDETSESLASSFEVTATPTPGTKNTCLP